MQARLIYVMDPMCPWCWGFANHLDALRRQAAQQGIATHLIVGGLSHAQPALEEIDRERHLRHWAEVQQVSGQSFDLLLGLPSGMRYQTEPACRALVAAGLLDSEGVWRLASAIARAFFLEGRDTAAAQELVLLAERVGYCRERFAECFDDPRSQKLTAQDFSWHQRLGLAGLPVLLAERDGQLALLANGYQPLEPLSLLLARWLERGAALREGTDRRSG